MATILGKKRRKEESVRLENINVFKIREGARLEGASLAYLGVCFYKLSKTRAQDSIKKLGFSFSWPF